MIKDRILLKNFVYLFILQNANFIIPLLLIPYLTNILGASNYGIISFTQAFISYFLLITDFGFNTYTTQKIAQNKRNKIKVSVYFWNTVLAKAILGLSCIIVLTLLVEVTEFLEQYRALIYISFLSILSSIIFPVWLFQGLEQMKYVSFVSIVPRCFVLLSTFLFIKEKNDLVLAFSIQVVGNLLSVLLSIWVCYYLELIKNVKPSFKISFRLIKESRHIFFSSVFSNLYTTTNTVILGILTNSYAVGVFSASEKIVRAVISLGASVSQVTFPRINSYYRESKEKARQFAKNIILVITLGCTLLGTFFFFNASWIMSKIYNVSEFKGVIEVFKIQSFLPLFSLINGVIGVNIFVTFGLSKEMFKIVSTVGVLNVFIVSVLCYIIGLTGAAWAGIISEILILCFFTYKIKSQRILFSADAK